MTQLARDNAIAKSSGYDYLHEGIDLLDAPDAQAGIIGRSSRESTRRLRRKRSSTWPHRGRDNKSASEIDRTGPATSSRSQPGGSREQSRGPAGAGRDLVAHARFGTL